MDGFSYNNHTFASTAWEVMLIIFCTEHHPWEVLLHIFFNEHNTAWEVMLYFSLNMIQTKDKALRIIKQL